MGKDELSRERGAGIPRWKRESDWLWNQKRRIGNRGNEDIREHLTMMFFWCPKSKTSSSFRILGLPNYQIWSANCFLEPFGKKYSDAHWHFTWRVNLETAGKGSGQQPLLTALGLACLLQVTKRTLDKFSDLRDQKPVSWCPCQKTVLQNLR